MDGRPMETLRPARLSAVERPVFVVGVERSGTTLLRSLLNAHSRLAIAPETHFMKLADAWGASGREAPADFERFWQALSGHFAVRPASVDISRVRAVVGAEGAGDFRSVLSALLAVQAACAGKARGGEKTPGHEHYLARIFAWYPDAQVVFVHRDPRACAASALLTPWVQAQLRPARVAAPLMRRMRASHIALKAEEWLRSHRIESACRGDARVISIGYEELIAAPAATLERLCAFLGEAFEPTMLENGAAAMIDPHKSSMRWRAWTIEHERRANSAISAKSLHRWRRTLTAGEVAMLEGVCAEGMAALGYAPTRSAAAQRRGRRRCVWTLWADGVERAGRRAAASLLHPPRAAGAKPSTRPAGLVRDRTVP